MVALNPATNLAEGRTDELVAYPPGNCSIVDEQPVASATKRNCIADGDQTRRAALADEANAHLRDPLVLGVTVHAENLDISHL
jgi:hypothetical protein